MEHSKKQYIQPEIEIYELEDFCVNVGLDTSNGVGAEESDAKGMTSIFDDETPDATATTNESASDKSMQGQLFR